MTKERKLTEFVSNSVLCSLSGMVEDLIEAGKIELYEYTQDLAEYEGNMITMSERDDLVNELEDKLLNAETEEEEEALQEKIDFLNDELDWDTPEILEYWAVDSWFANKLKEKNEVIIDEYNVSIWGRQTSGQDIFLDEVISEIYNELHVENTDNKIEEKKVPLLIEAVQKTAVIPIKGEPVSSMIINEANSVPVIPVPDKESRNISKLVSSDDWKTCNSDLVLVTKEQIDNKEWIPAPDKDTQVANTSSMSTNLKDESYILNSKVLETVYVIIDLTTGDEIINCSMYECRDMRYSTMYCILWIYSHNKIIGSGKGQARGGGYHLNSAAVAAAIDNAGIKLFNSIAGVGDLAIIEALEAIAKSEGYTCYKLIKVYSKRLIK